MKKVRKALMTVLMAALMAAMLTGCQADEVLHRLGASLENITASKEAGQGESAGLTGSASQPGQENAETPQENTETPQENAETPQENTETPQENAETPQENTETPQENTETPQENPETPQENTEMPQENTETPQENTEATQQGGTEETPEGGEGWASNGMEGISESNGHVIVIDPGHQAQGDSAQEPVGPGSTQTKDRVTSGTVGCVSGLAEYELNLEVSLKLRDELQNRGYTVYLTRETHDVNISNKERAERAQQLGAEIMVRVHANGSNDGTLRGALAMAVSSENPYVPQLAGDSQRLAQSIVDNYCAVTGFANGGLYSTDEMSGLNWASMPAAIIELGYMSNEEDDYLMADSGFQSTMVMGIANGIDRYFR